MASSAVTVALRPGTVALNGFAAIAGNGSHHFQILDAKHDDYFEDQLELSIKKLSKKILCVDEHELTTSDGSPSVLVSITCISKFH
jgi:hypothetical protein